MAAITNNQEKTWKKEAIDRADVLMAWLGHFAVPVLAISMFVLRAGMFPGTSETNVQSPYSPVLCFEG